MRLLLDTHVWIWGRIESGRLGAGTRVLLAARANTIFLSAASAWEASIKWRLGKLDLPSDPLDFVRASLSESSLIALPVSIEHSCAVARLPEYHSDPFDRMLIAQALHEKLEIVTADVKIRRYDVPVRWALD